MDAGARVGVHYNSSATGAETVAARADGSVAIGADLSRPEDCRAFFAAAVDALGGIDVLVNNAAVADAVPLDGPPGDHIAGWRRTLDVNLISPAVLISEAIAHFRPRGGGRIINIASRAAFRGDEPEFMAYAASKGGMVALSRSIARGFGRDGVKCFTVAPGFTRTEMARPFMQR